MRSACTSTGSIGTLRSSISCLGTLATRNRRGEYFLRRLLGADRDVLREMPVLTPLRGIPYFLEVHPVAQDLDSQSADHARRGRDRGPLR
jgi:hypothetical protein